MKTKVRFLIIGSSLLIAVCLSFAALAFSPATTVNAQDDKGKGKTAPTIVLKGEKTKTRGSEDDPNIKNDSDKNTADSKDEPPPNKGGAKSRGGKYCEVRVDNRTRFYIKIYVDGNYKGTIAPYGDAVAYAYPGETKVYARADFDDGSILYWGPKTYDCGPYQFIPFRLEN